MSQLDRMIKALKEEGILDRLSRESAEQFAIGLGFEMLAGHGKAHEEFMRYAFNLAVSKITDEIMKKGE